VSEHVAMRRVRKSKGEGAAADRSVEEREEKDRER
jgi:hypothetical protein